ncbi:5-bromo-4-chloroindolyl phosphate hydrolysis protein [Rhodovulum imhoffii]|uniref:5-bromo-4-chloroindolyl phosphate hydrolysis protein n=1 Tax=Rhodovulum imhoffii TaxID=365340 RepID=A0A2T5BW25_9RHOB|nr:5-bromo-4-chloroindolyl phosphate hydrolysis family protein [Rhodovulum imhoffii]MBK5935195.1 hypothetical protein [Rhodovulum imhoffii]PTN03837.1 5-bromo-4-chloroindolyl phosphate hydrolysis protein [Rhodovulum imhoffii]
MAQRFGGKYSPTQAPKGAGPRNVFHGKRRSRVGARANFLFMAALPLLPRAFNSDPVGLALSLLAFGALVLSAWLTREGLKAEEAWAARKVARRPAFPRKIFGAVLMGLGLFLAGFTPGGSLIESLIYGGFGTGLHLLAFGLDPMKDKGMEGIDAFQQDRVARAVDEAERHLADMLSAIRRAGDRALELRVEQFQTTAREMFRTIEEDPRDLTGARKYLGVYLLGARDAAIKFADFYSRTRDARARADFENLLNDLEENFAARTREMLLDDRTDLDVEIEVLRDRLQREGVHA